MSNANRRKRLHDPLFLFKAFLYLFVGCILILPLALLIPKKKNLVIVFGRGDGEFLDNAKYMFLHIHEHRAGCEYYFLTADQKVYELLKDKGMSALRFPSLISIYYLLRAKIMIADNTTWILDWKYYLLFFAKKIQLWHGVGFKRIEMDLFSKNLSPTAWAMKKFYFILTGRFPKYDLFVTTSDFYKEKVFAKALRYKEILTTGYPRNDVLFKNADDAARMNVDEESLKRIKAYKARNKTIVLYAPTFRRGEGEEKILQNDPISDKAFDLGRLLDFAEANNIVFLFKFHPGAIKTIAGCTSKRTITNNKGMEKVLQLKDEHFIWYDPFKDIYPVFQEINILITDYSSIYMDYLMLDRPVLFFCYDYDRYVGTHRELEFDYDWITPGPKCFTQDQLEREITNLIGGGKDLFGDKRKEIRDLAFLHQDGESSLRLWNIIVQKYFKTT